MRRWKGPLSLAVTLAAVSAVAAAPAPALAADPPCTGWYAMTFDDGPTESTPQLLAALQAAGVKATFFDVGQQVQSFPTYAHDEWAAGHVVGNHTWNHPALVNGSLYADNATTLDPSTGLPYGTADLTDAQILDQLNRTNDALVAAGVPKPTFVRPPYGEWNVGYPTITRDLSTGPFAQLGLKNTMWTVETGDANAPAATTEQIVAQALTVQNGGVILMHDGYPNTTIPAIPQIVSGLRAKGLCAGPLGDSTTPILAYNGNYYVKAVAAPDTTKPTISVTSPQATLHYKQGQVVTPTYTCSDDQDPTPTCEATPIDTSTAGTKTFTVTSKDKTGNTASTTVGYVVDDTTLPTISLTSPTQGAHYSQGQSATAGYSCQDNVSVASCDGSAANGAALDTSSAGTKTFTVNAKDAAGNSRSTTVSYVVDAPPAPPTQPTQQPAPHTTPAPSTPSVAPSAKPKAPALSTVAVTKNGRPATILSLRSDLKLALRVDRAANLTLIYRQKVCPRGRRCTWVARRTEKLSVPRAGAFTHTLHRRLRSGTLPVGEYYLYVTAANTSGSTTTKQPIRVL